jgi:hypothetical protein
MSPQMNNSGNTAAGAHANFAPEFDGARRIALIVGIVGLAASIPGLIWSPQQFFRSYLLAFIYCLGVPLGCMAILMMHHLTGGGWGYLIRRALEAGTRTIGVMAIFYIPLLFGMHQLYPWTHPGAGGEPQYRQNHFYLNTPFFIGRLIFYFAVWFGLTWLLNRMSVREDEAVDRRASGWLEGMSGPGLILWGMTITYSSVDWIMSLEPTWFSTIYGMLMMIVATLSALAFVILVARRTAVREPISQISTPQRFNDLGNLLLTFVMLWAYLGFSQFLIIWSGNTTEEITWYMSRARGSWAGLALILIIFHFAVPFALLLSRDVKRKPGSLSRVAALLIGLTLIDLYWLLVPAFEKDGPSVHWTNLTTVAGIAGIWLWAYFGQLSREPLLPARDPQLIELMEEDEREHARAHA